MKFQMPSEFQKEIAESTKKVYAGKLNALAREGFETVASIQADPKLVIAAIKKITGEADDDKTRNARRYFISAIFYVAKFPKKNPFYTYYQKCLPSKVFGTDTDWVTRKKYVEED